MLSARVWPRSEPGHQRAVHRRWQPLARAPLCLGHGLKPSTCHDGSDLSISSSVSSLSICSSSVWSRDAHRPPGDDRRDGYQRPLAQAAGPDPSAVADVVGDVRERVPDRVEPGPLLGVPGQRRTEQQRADGHPSACGVAARRGERDAPAQARRTGSRTGRCPARSAGPRSVPRRARRQRARRPGAPPTRCPARPRPLAAAAAAGRRARAAPAVTAGQGCRTRGARFAG